MPSLMSAAFRLRAVRVTALAFSLLVPAGALAASAPTCGDRFVVVRGPNVPVLIGSSTDPEIIVVQGLATPPARISISSGCEPVAVHVKATKQGTTMKATWPANGCGAEGKVKLGATLDSACRLSGVLKKRKSKPIHFAAAPSACGDGVVDAGRAEECEPSLGCTASRRCRTDCRCTAPVTIVTLPPRTPTTTVTTTTSTTLPPSGTCGDADAPVCDGTCAGDNVCSIGVCVDNFQPCFANADCDSNYCFVDPGLCASFQSCFTGDECASGLCGTFDSCFCWYF